MIKTFVTQWVMLVSDAAQAAVRDSGQCECSLSRIFSGIPNETGSLVFFFPSSPGIQCGPDQASVVETRATDFDQALALCEIVLVHQKSKEILRHNPCPQRVYHLFGKIRHKNMKSKSLMKDLNNSSRQW